MIKKLKDNLRVNPSTFNARIKEVKYEWKIDNIITEGRFFIYPLKVDK